jgi:hypothetical protein
MGVRPMVRARTARAAFALCVLTAGVLAAAPSAGLSGRLAPASAQAAGVCTPPPVLPPSSLTAGMQGTGYTVLSGRTISPFPVEILGVLPGGIAPGLDFILIKAPNGIAAGYSGSPVYVNGKLIGAVSYGLFSDDNTIGGVTPAAPMIDLLGYPSTESALSRIAAATHRVTLSPKLRLAVAEAAGVSASSVPMAARHLTVPLAVSGLNDRAMTRLSGIFARNGIDVAAFRAGSAAIPSTASPAPLVAGSSFAATLSYGDLTFGGIGTTTLSCGGQTLAFGHPMDFTGSTLMGMNAADVLTVVPSAFGAYKVANVAELRGTVDQDRLAGLRGVSGRMPALTRVTSTVSNVDLGRSRDGETDVVTPDYIPLISAFHLLSNEDSVFDRIGGGGAGVTFTVNGERQNGDPFQLVRQNHFYSSYDASGGSIYELAGYLNLMMQNPFERIHISSVDVDASVTQANTTETITRVLSASTLMRPGYRSTLYVRRGGVIMLRVLLRPAYRVGDPVPPERAVSLRVQVPLNSQGGYVRIGGGRSNLGCIFCFGDEGGSSAYDGLGSFDGVLNRLNAQARGSDLVVTFSSYGGYPRSVTASSVGKRVIFGTRYLRIRVI